MAVSLFGSAHAGPIGCYAVAGNIVANCGFETGDTTSWKTLGDAGGGVGATNADSNTGTYSLALVGGGPDSGSEAEAYQSLSTQSGTTYDLTFYVKGSFSGTAFTEVVVAGLSQLGAWTVFDSLSLSSWTKESFTFTADSNKVVLYAFLAGRDPTGTLYFDDFSVTPQAVPEPGSLALLGTGILSAGFFGWRRRNRKDA